MIGADAPLVLGNKLSFDLVATSGDLAPRSASVTDALVTGRPGMLDTTFGAAQTGLARLSFGNEDAGGFTISMWSATRSWWLGRALAVWVAFLQGHAPDEQRRHRSWLRHGHAGEGSLRAQPQRQLQRRCGRAPARRPDHRHGLARDTQARGYRASAL